MSYTLRQQPASYIVHSGGCAFRQAAHCQNAVVALHMQGSGLYFAVLHPTVMTDIFEEKACAVEVPALLVILPGTGGEHVTAVSVVEATAIDADAVALVDVVVGPEGLAAGELIAVVAAHGDALVVVVGHECCHPAVQAWPVFYLAQFAAWGKDVAVGFIALAGVVCEMIVAHVAADIHLSGGERYVW